MPRNWTIAYWIIASVCFVTGFVFVMGSGIEAQMLPPENTLFAVNIFLGIGYVLLLPLMIVGHILESAGLNLGVMGTIGFLIGIVANFAAYYVIVYVTWYLFRRPRRSRGP